MHLYNWLCIIKQQSDKLKKLLCNLRVHDQKQAEKNCSTACESIVKLQTEKETVIEPVKAWINCKLEKETVIQPVRA